MILAIDKTYYLCYISINRSVNRICSDKNGKETIKMANKYAGTKTEQNLMAAFAGESEARNKYT